MNFFVLSSLLWRESYQSWKVPSVFSKKETVMKQQCLHQRCLVSHVNLILYFMELWDSQILLHMKCLKFSCSQWALCCCFMHLLECIALKYPLLKRALQCTSTVYCCRTVQVNKCKLSEMAIGMLVYLWQISTQVGIFA